MKRPQLGKAPAQVAQDHTRVFGIDWLNHRVLLDRTIANEWVDIAKVAISAATPENG